MLRRKGLCYTRSTEQKTNMNSVVLHIKMDLRYISCPVTLPEPVPVLFVLAACPSRCSRYPFLLSNTSYAKTCHHDSTMAKRLYRKSWCHNGTWNRGKSEHVERRIKSANHSCYDEKTEDCNLGCVREKTDYHTIIFRKDADFPPSCAIMSTLDSRRTISTPSMFASERLLTRMCTCKVGLGTAVFSLDVWLCRGEVTDRYLQLSTRVSTASLSFVSVSPYLTHHYPESIPWPLVSFRLSQTFTPAQILTSNVSIPYGRRNKKANTLLIRRVEVSNLS